MGMIVDESVRSSRAGAGRSAPAVPSTVVGVVATGRNDPIVPSQGFETHEEPLLAALPSGRAAIQGSSPSQTPNVRFSWLVISIVFSLWRGKHALRWWNPCERLKRVGVGSLTWSSPAAAAAFFSSV